jgi:hypothetical protein
VDKQAAAMSNDASTVGGQFSTDEDEQLEM